MLLTFFLASDAGDNFKEVTQEGCEILDNSIVAIGGWLEHLVGVARPAEPHEYVANGPLEQVHLCDGNHRLVFNNRMYVLSVNLFFIYCFLAINFHAVSRYSKTHTCVYLGSFLCTWLKALLCTKDASLT